VDADSLQPPAHAGFSLADFSTLKMEAIRSSETSVHTISTRRHIPENGVLLQLLFSFCVLSLVNAMLKFFFHFPREKNVYNVENDPVS
jgi:hypothetical protein